MAIRATGESVVELTGVEVRGATGLELAGTTRVSATDSTLRGSAVAIAARDRAQVALMDTEVQGPITQDETARVTGAEATDEAGGPGPDDDEEGT